MPDFCIKIHQIQFWLRLYPIPSWGRWWRSLKDLNWWEGLAASVRRRSRRTFSTHF